MDSPTPTDPALSAPAEPAVAPAPITESSSLSLHALRYSKTLPELTATALSQVTQAAAEEPILAPTIPESRGWILVKAAGVFILTFALVFSGLEGPALFQRASYFFRHLGRPGTADNLAFLPSLEDRPVRLSDIKNRPQDYLTPSGQLAGYTLTDLSDNQLLIPKISVNAPIIWGSSPDETTMLANLQKGVVQYGFTARPSDGTGNVFLSGHSSYLLWDPGKYKTVFANLDRLATGDQLAITYNGLVYIYEVTGSKVVKPTDTSVLAQTAEPTLSLMTCVPVGTNLNRLVVSAKLITAASNRPIPVTPQALTDPAAIFHYLPFE